MPVAYSEDLRWRVIWLSIVQGLSYRSIAKVLFMSEKSVYRYLRQFHSTGRVEPMRANGNHSNGLSEFEIFTIIQSILHNPKAYLEEVRQELYDITGNWVHESTICRTIHKHGFTRKRVQTIALQQSETKRIQFMADISAYDPEMFIWIDESGFNRRNAIRLFGYSIRGIRPQSHVLKVHGERICAIPIMTLRGIENIYLTSSTVNVDVFEHFICQCLLPIILPFNGINPRSVVIMDNCSIHHLERVYDIITGVGAKLLFLPPYSPDLMPLEEAFSKVKYVLKINEEAFLHTLTPALMVKLAFSSLTKEDCINYVKHAGYL